MLYLPATLSVSITRTRLPGSLSPIVMSGTWGATDLQVVGMREPILTPANAGPPPSPFEHGEFVALSSLRNTDWVFKVRPSNPASQTASRALIKALEAAVTRQVDYTLTVTINGGTPEPYMAHPGPFGPDGDAKHAELVTRRPTYVMTVPCQPLVLA